MAAGPDLDQLERMRERTRARKRRDLQQRAREFTAAWRYLIEAATYHQTEIPDDVKVALLRVEEWARQLVEE